MTERVRRYRAAALALAVAGTVTATTAGIVGVAVGLVAGVVLAAAAVVTGRTATTVLAGAGLLTGAVALLRSGGVDQHDVPPAVVAALLLVVVAAVGVRARRASEVDAATVAGLGLCIVGAASAVGGAAIVPLVLDTSMLVAALWTRQRAHRGHEPRRTTVAPLRRVVGVAVGVAALVALAAPVPSSAGLHDSLFHRHGGSGSSTSSDLVSPDAFDSSTLDLDVRGTLSTAPVATVTGDAPELWRGAVYDTYDGSAWHKPGVPVGQQDPPAPVVTGEGPSTVALAPTAVDPRHAGRTERVVVVPAGGGETTTGLYAPGVVVSVTAPGRVHLAAAGSAGVGGFGGRPAAYAEDVVLPVTDTAALDRATGGDPSGWTQLPSTLPQRVRDLAGSITAGATTRTAEVAAVEDYLRAHERYTLQAPVSRSGRDAVDDFLFRSHEGFCEQFASAETVLLRAVGVPARLVTGFAYGTPDGDGGRMFSQADAHAWVEVAYGSAGWSTSDPTAGSQLLPARASLADHVRGFLRSLGHSSAHRAELVGAVVVPALVVVGVARSGRRRRSRRDRSHGPVGAAFARLERRWPRPPASTPREYAASLPGDLGAAVAAWEAELYAPAGARGTDARAAVAQVTALRRSRRRPPGGPLALLVAGALLLVHPATTAAHRTADLPTCTVACLDTLVTDPTIGPASGDLTFLHTGTHDSYELPGDVIVTSSASSARRTPGVGAVRSPVVVRGVAGTATYDPPSGRHELQWTEAGRVMSVSFPLDVTAPQARATLASWRVHRAG